MTTLLASAHNLSLQSEADALDVLSSGLAGCIFTPEDVHPEFFDLQNGIAGEIFQKFVNYNFRVAFIVTADHQFGERVTELIRDHSRHPCIRFFETVEAAESWLTS